VEVLVGAQVDTAGKAGKPVSVTGFQTFNTPVLLTVGEKAVITSKDLEPLTNHLEGWVLVKCKKQQQSKDTVPKEKAIRKNSK